MTDAGSKMMTETGQKTEMGCKYERELKIFPSMCDHNSRLSIPAALNIFQDYATLHADYFEIGPDGMDRRNAFWIITKIRLHINRMPKMMDELTVKTWIQEADRASCERDFAITDGDEVLVYGRSIWAVISRDTGRLVHMKELYPVVEFNVAPPDDRNFIKIDKHFEEAEEIGTYTVRSSDIDLGGHLNNVNYVRAMIGCFDSETLDNMDISEIELNYISQTYEGDTLTFKYRRSEGGFELGALNDKGKTVFVAALS